MTTSPDELALRRACDAAPLEDGPRLALADFLDESDRPQEACDLRLAVALRRVCEEPAEDGPRLEYARINRDYGWGERAEFIELQCERERELGSGCAMSDRKWELLEWFRAEDWAAEFGLPNHETIMTIDTGFYVPGWGTELQMRRGFVSAVTCTAADWLAHADQIAWHPGQTVECPEVRDPKLDVFAGNSDGTAIEYQRHKFCPACKGTGRVPRPCPATAQPVTRVTLTTAPEGHWVDDGGEMVFWFTRGTTVVRSVREAQVYEMRNRRGTFGGTPHTMLDVLETAWPGVVFTLPPEPV